MSATAVTEPRKLRGRERPLELGAGRINATLVILAAALALAGTAACASIPQGKASVDDIRFTGNSNLSGSDLEDKVATTESPKFLLLFRGLVFDYELFDRFVLQRDLDRVERFYRARGYYEAHARAGRVDYTDDDHVRITVDIEEGTPVKIRSVRVMGLDELSQADRDAALAAVNGKLKDDAIFDEGDFQAGDVAITRALTDRGYAYADVVRKANVDLPKHVADLSFTVTPDQQSTYGDIFIEGLGQLPDGPVRATLKLKPGDRFSTADILSAQQALLDLGVFSSVDIEPDLAKPPPTNHVVPLHVKVDPTKLRSVQLGGGIELDVIKTDLHVMAGWENLNFLGGLRHFSVQFKPGVVLYPTRLGDLIVPTNILPEERTRVELRQPNFVEARTNGILRTEFNIYPVILTPQVDKSAPVLGYQEFKQSAGLDRTIWKFYFNPSYNVQYNVPFAYLGEKDPLLSSVLITYPGFLAYADFRDDKVHPHRGIYISNELQVGIPFGNAIDVREQPEVRAYIPIGRGRVTLALRGSVGFLFPFNYGDTVQEQATNGNQPIPDAQRGQWEKDTQLVYFRGFFSGGPSSNRGYPLRGVGPHGIVPFFNPGIAAVQLANECDAKNANFDAARCAVPLGGLTLWETSVELRFPISGPLWGSTFCDASDVSAVRANIRLNNPHVSCGIGARYDTPVGPIRLDLGYRIPGLNPNFTDPKVIAVEGDPGTLFGIPIAIAFGIGEAF